MYFHFRETKKEIRYVDRAESVGEQKYISDETNNCRLPSHGKDLTSSVWRQASPVTTNDDVTQETINYPKQADLQVIEVHPAPKTNENDTG